MSSYLFGSAPNFLNRWFWSFFNLHQNFRQRYFPTGPHGVSWQVTKVILGSGEGRVFRQLGKERLLRSIKTLSSCLIICMVTVFVVDITNIFWLYIFLSSLQSCNLFQHSSVVCLVSGDNRLCCSHWKATCPAFRWWWGKR